MSPPYLESRVAVLESEVSQLTTSLKAMSSTLSAIDDRLRLVERLAWIAVGGTTIMGGVFYTVSERVMALLVK